MQQIAIQLKSLEIYTHEAHHQTSGASFFADHAALNDFYDAYGDAYDSVIERMIGLNIPVDERELNIKAVAEMPTRTDWFYMLLEEEAELRRLISEEYAKTTCGTQNLLSQLADDSEVRTYKLNQRTK